MLTADGYSTTADTQRDRSPPATRLRYDTSNRSLAFFLEDEQDEQNTTVPRRRADQPTRVLSRTRGQHKVKSCSPSCASTIRRYYTPRGLQVRWWFRLRVLIQAEKEFLKTRIIHPYCSHIIRIALGIQTLFMDMPPLAARLVCFPVHRSTTTSISHSESAIQIPMPLFASVYVIFQKCIAAMIVIYEFMNRK